MYFNGIPSGVLESFFYGGRGNTELREIVIENAIFEAGRHDRISVSNYE